MAFVSRFLHVYVSTLSRHRIRIISYRTHTDSKNVGSCYKTLGVSPECEQAELKEAFLSLAKKYHPDSGLDTADSDKFTHVEQAYRTIVTQRQKDEKLTNEEAEEEERIIFDIRHTAPQHRQFLSYDGIGFGTPSQRQKQYETYKVSKASSNVYDYKQQKLEGETETSLVVKDKKAAKNIKTRYGMERLVEDLIQESMNKGEFDNLTGKGKPLNPKVEAQGLDVTDYNLNRIMIDSGFAPEWVMLQGDIRKDLAKIRNDLLRTRTALGPEPYTAPFERDRWERQITKTNEHLELINKNIHKLNFIVPALHMQMMPVTLKRELARSQNDYEEKREKGELPMVQQDHNMARVFPHEIGTTMYSEQRGWRDILRDILQVFGYR